MNTKIGLIAVGVYGITAVYLLATQGLFGESFIALILGMPWSLAFSFFEYGDASESMLKFMVLFPIVLNAYLLYRLGNRLSRMS